MCFHEHIIIRPREMKSLVLVSFYIGFIKLLYQVVGLFLYLITSFRNRRGINNITKRPGIESPTCVWVLFERAIYTPTSYYSLGHFRRHLPNNNVYTEIQKCLNKLHEK